MLVLPLSPCNSTVGTSNRALNVIASSPYFSSNSKRGWANTYFETELSNRDTILRLFQYKRFLHVDGRPKVDRKKSMVWRSPYSSSQTGDQLRRLLAWEISGFLRLGSSCGISVRTILDFEPTIATTLFDNSLMVCSTGFPRLIGPTTESSDSIINMRPSTRSST